MYADFGTVSFSAMSNSQPSAPKKGSETVQCGSPSGATTGSLRRHEIPAQEHKEGDSGVEAGDHAEGASPAPLAADKDDSLQEEIAESSGAYGDDPSKKVVEDQEGSNRLGDCGGDDDDGYHTPTSPRCRIPTDLPCPPAPRKMLPKRRWQKRNPGDQEIYRVVRRRIQLPGEFELVLHPVVDGPLAAGLPGNGAGGDDIIRRRTC